MTTIGPSVTIADRPHRMTWQNPGPAVANGDGSYTLTWTDLVPPTTSVKIAPATTATLERLAAGTVLSTASHVVSGPYHPQIKTTTRGLFNGRIFNVIGVANPEERNVETIAICVEVVL
jgi:head-tail adaptor